MATKKRGTKVKTEDKSIDGHSYKNMTSIDNIGKGRYSITLEVGEPFQVDLNAGQAKSVEAFLRHKKQSAVNHPPVSDDTAPQVKRTPGIPSKLDVNRLKMFGDNWMQYLECKNQDMMATLSSIGNEAERLVSGYDYLTRDMLVYPEIFLASSKPGGGANPHGHCIRDGYIGLVISKSDYALRQKIRRQTNLLPDTPGEEIIR